MTPRDLITLALKQAGVIGIGQTPLAEDVNDAVALASMMLAQWNRKRYLLYHLREVRGTLTGAASYSIGPLETADIPARGRIVGIEAAYWRYDPSGGPTLDGTTGAFSADFGAGYDSAAGGDPAITASGIDYPLSVIRSREDFARVTMKGISGQPSSVWLDADYPIGRVHVWPVSAQGELRLVVQDQLITFPDLSSDIQLPEEYHEAIFYNLVARLRSTYGKPPDPVVIGLAKAAMNTIRVANAQIGTLSIDPALLPRSGWGGDIFFGAGGVAGAPAIGGGTTSPDASGSVTPGGGTTTPGTGGGTTIPAYGVLDFSDAANSGLHPAL